MTIHVNEARFTVSWSEEDGEYVATSEKYPGLSHLSDDPVIALQLCRALVRDVMLEEAEP